MYIIRRFYIRGYLEYIQFGEFLVRILSYHYFGLGVPISPQIPFTHIFYLSSAIGSGNPPPSAPTTTDRSDRTEATAAHRKMSDGIIR